MMTYCSPWQRSMALGCFLGIAVVGIDFAIEVALFGTSTSGFAFTERASDLPAAVLSAYAHELTMGLVLVYGCFALFLGCVLALSNALTFWTGLHTKLRLIEFDVALLFWLWLTGELRLLARHPYAQSHSLWTRWTPELQNILTPNWATFILIVIGVLLLTFNTRGCLWRRRLFMPLVLINGLVVGAPIPESEINPKPKITSQSAGAPLLEKPPVIIIGLDSFRPDHVSALGGPKGLTPNLDHFFQEAFVFSQAHTSIGRTHPSWISMLVADTPDHHGVRYNRPDPWFTNHLPVTLPTHLKTYGYRTRFLTDDNLFSSMSKEHGFDMIEQPPEVYKTYAAQKLGHFWLIKVLPSRFVSKVLPVFNANRPIFHNYEASDFTANIKRALTQEAATQQPFFLAAHLCVLHYPGTQPGPLYRAFQGKDPVVSYESVSLATLSRQAASISEYDANRMAGLYTAGIVNADRQIGDLIAHLKTIGFYNSSWIVIWSDHGESFQDDLGRPTPPNHGMFLNNGDQDLRVLLAVKPPLGKAPPGITEQLVRTVDLAPTLLEGMGLQPLPGSRDGVSLWKLWQGEPFPELPMYAETEIKWMPLVRYELGYSFHLTQLYNYLPSFGDLVVRMAFHREIVLGKYRSWQRGQWKITRTPTKTGEWHLWNTSETNSKTDVSLKNPVEFGRLKDELTLRIDQDFKNLENIPIPALTIPLIPPWWPWSQKSAASVFLESQP